MTDSADCQCPICGRLHRHLGSPPPSVMEQIARDMRNGDFPKKSEQTLAEEGAASSDHAPYTRDSDNMAREAVANAMATKRRELQHLPLERIWGELAEAALAQVPRSAARIDEPQRAPASCPHCIDATDCASVDVCCAVEAVYAAPTTSPEPLNSRATAASPEPDAVREALKPFAMIKDFAPIGDGKIDRVLIEVSVKDIDVARAALSRPAHGGWLTRDEIAKVIDPSAFQEDERLRHLYCSPFKVERVQQVALDTADKIVALAAARKDDQAGGARS